MNHSHTNLLSKLAEEEGNALLRYGGYQATSSGEVLLHEGQHSGTLRLVLSGTLETVDGDVNRAILPGETIGVVNALNPGRASMTILAKEESTLWAIRHHNLHRFLVDHPQAFDAFLDCLESERALTSSGKQVAQMQPLAA